VKNPLTKNLGIRCGTFILEEIKNPKSSKEEDIVQRSHTNENPCPVDGVVERSQLERTCKGMQIINTLNLDLPNELSKGSISH
jgi:hypothetical protein